MNIADKTPNFLLECERLVEGKQVGVLYHFTTAYAGSEIVFSDKLIPKEGGGISFDGESYVIDRFRDWVSLTRNYNLHATANAGGANQSWGEMRIAFDGDILSNNHKIEPYHDDDGVLTRHDGQAEERIVGGAKKIAAAIIQIDFNTQSFIDHETNFDQWVSPPNSHEREKYRRMAEEDVTAFIRAFHEKGIICNIVKDFSVPVSRRKVNK